MNIWTDDEGLVLESDIGGSQTYGQEINRLRRDRGVIAE